MNLHAGTDEIVGVKDLVCKSKKVCKSKNFVLGTKCTAGLCISNVFCTVAGKGSSASSSAPQWPLHGCQLCCLIGTD